MPKRYTVGRKEPASQFGIRDRQPVSMTVQIDIRLPEAMVEFL